MSNQITFENYDKPVEYNLKRLEKNLDGVSNVIGVQHRLSERFTLLFRENFGDIPFHNSDRPRSISNWTHHTYYAIMNTAKILGLVCTFETMGRLDAVIGTFSEYPGVILLAEWESDGFSIFGDSNELDKLRQGIDQYDHADAFLFTYCPLNSLDDFTKKVVEYWQNSDFSRQNKPSLFLTMIVFKRINQSNEFIFIRTIEISSTCVGLWHDLAFVTFEDYKQFVENS